MLHKAAYNNSLELAKLLIGAGAKVTAEVRVRADRIWYC